MLNWLHSHASCMIHSTCVIIITSSYNIYHLVQVAELSQFNIYQHVNILLCITCIYCHYIQRSHPCEIQSSRGGEAGFSHPLESFGPPGHNLRLVQVWSLEMQLESFLFMLTESTSFQKKILPENSMDGIFPQKKLVVCI